MIFNKQSPNNPVNGLIKKISSNTSQTITYIILVINQLISKELDRQHILLISFLAVSEEGASFYAKKFF